MARRAMGAMETPKPPHTPHFINKAMLGPLFVILGCILIGLLYCLIGHFCKKLRKVRRAITRFF